MQVNLDDNEPVDVQMAPLIDCVFLLLIFFLVATTLKKIEMELPLELPEATLAAMAVPQRDGLTVSIDAQGLPYLGTDPVTNSILQDRLRQAAEEDAEQPVRINADRNAPWHAVIQVLEIAKFEGLNDVRPGTRPDAQRQ